MKKRILSMILTLCMLLSLFPVMTAQAAFTTATNVTLSDAVYHDNGSLKSIKATFDWASGDALGRLVLMKSYLRNPGDPGTDSSYGDFTDYGYYADNFDWYSFDEVVAYDNANHTFGILSYTEEVELNYRSEGNEIVLEPDEGDISMDTDSYYYVYLWTNYGQYYPDNLIMALRVNDGVLEYTPATSTDRNSYDADAFVRVRPDTKPLENVTFGYAYDAQRDPAFPKNAGDNVRFHDLKAPLNADGSRGSEHAGSWTLSRFGTYFYLEIQALANSNMAHVVNTFAGNYGLDKDSVVIYELKNGGSHVAYGVVVAYNAKDGYAAFIGDNHSTGAGYLLAVDQITGTEVNMTSDMLATDFVPECSIELNKSGTQTIESTMTVTVRNTGNTATGALTVTLSGSGANGFVLGGVDSAFEAGIAKGGTDTFTVAPKTGVAAGTYEAMVTAGGADVAPKSFGVTFTVISTHTVSFDANGHGAAPGAISDVVDGSTVSEPVAPTAAGYTFGGWYKEAACTNAWDFTSDTVTDDVTLYAKWTFNELETVTFGYAYDAQRNPDYPTAEGEELRFYNLKKPLIDGTNRKDVNTGSWTLSRFGTYFYLKSEGLADHYISTVVENIAGKYGLAEDAVVIHELKDNGTHIAYGVVIAYNAEEGYAAFIGENWSSGAGYLLTLSAISGTEARVTSDMIATDFVPECSIGLDKTGTQSFENANAGYQAGDLTAITVTVTNTGDAATGALSASVTGSNFVLGGVDAAFEAGIAKDGTDTITVTPKVGLAAGTYTATVTVGGVNVAPKSFDVTFTVISRHTVTFNANGRGTAPAPVADVVKGTAIAAPTAPAVAGYTFGGWYKEAACTNEWNFTSDVVNADITLYAKWTANTYTVKFNANKPATATSEVTGAMLAQTHTYDAELALTGSAYALTGWTFMGWAESAAGTVKFADGETVKNLASAQDAVVELFAVWQANTYTVTFHANRPANANPVLGSVTNEVEGTMAAQTHTYDTALELTDSAYALTGFTFLGWATTPVDENEAAEYTDAQSVMSLNATDGGNVDLYAVWQRNTYTFTLDGNGGSCEDAASTEIEFTFGQSRQLPIDQFERRGCKFSIWTVKAGDSKTWFVSAADFCIVDESDGQITFVRSTDGEVYTFSTDSAEETYWNQTFYARWAARSSGSTVSTTKLVDIAHSGRGTVTAGSRYANTGTQVTLTIKADEGYAVDTLTVVTAAGQNVEITKVDEVTYTFVMPDANVEVAAVFKQADTVCHGYTDIVLDAWYHTAVHYCIENGLMVGTSDTTFAPDTRLSRAMVVQVLYNYEKNPNAPINVNFDDVADGQWYTDAIRWAADKGVVAGYGNGKFGPDDNVTVEQVAVILWNYTGTPAGNTADLSALGSYSDWAVNALNWAVANGIFEGMPVENVDATATRAQTAQMLINFLSK